MVIYYSENYMKYRNALGKANEYWLDLGYCKLHTDTLNKKNDVFYCDRYAVFVRRYCIHVDAHYYELNEKEIEEIRTLVGFFINKKTKGFVDKFSSSDSQDLIDCVMGIPGVQKTSSIITCDWSHDDIERCLAFVNKIPKNADNSHVLNTLSQILVSLDKNTSRVQKVPVAGEETIDKPDGE